MMYSKHFLLLLLLTMLITRLLCVQFLENLYKCHNLRILELSHNAIERMDGPSPLIRLGKLNLSHNIQ